MNRHKSNFIESDDSDLDDKRNTTNSSLIDYGKVKSSGMDFLGFNAEEFATPERMMLKKMNSFNENRNVLESSNVNTSCNKVVEIDDSPAVLPARQLCLDSDESTSEDEVKPGGRKIIKRKKSKKKSKKKKTKLSEPTDLQDNSPSFEEVPIVELSSNDDDSEHNDEDDSVDMVADLFSKCNEISELLSNQLNRDTVQFQDGATMSVLSKEQANDLFPDGMSIKDYQLVGLNWLRLLYFQDLNGILADEMGLGKTIQAISLLAWLRQYENISGPHLIVAPASTLENWRREIGRWLPGQRVYVYHGSQSDRARLANTLRYSQNYDIIITTYTYFERESCSADRALFKRLRFVYTIYDEAHAIKNMGSSRYRRLICIQSQRRVLLSGTPVQNNMNELLTLMSFCMPTVFDASSPQIQQYFRDFKTNTSEAAKIRQALKPFILRRVKNDVLRSLSPKIEKIVLVNLSPVQKLVYDEILQEGKRCQNNSKSLSNTFSMLRKAANHALMTRFYFGKDEASSPDGVDRSMSLVKRLLRQVYAFGTEATAEMIDAEVENYSDWDLHILALEYANKNQRLADMQLPSAALWNSSKCCELRQLLPQLCEEGHRVLLFSQWTTILDILEEVVGFLQLEYVRFDGQTDVSDRQEIIDRYNNTPSIQVFLLSTRAGGMGINLTSADTVIIYDLDFNPTVDRQAEDRCHRIGQEKTVTVYKLVSQDTVDENILNISLNKKELDETVLMREDGQTKPSECDLDTIKQIMKNCLS